MAGLEGVRLGAYELQERIGGGGMAEVYRAKQLTAFNREVAIKVIRTGYSEDASFRERFLREAQAISKLSHPNILPLIEFGEQDQTLYLVMPLAREGTLRDLLRQRNGPLSLEEAVPLFVQLCDAVQYAHEERIIHRDLKPQNVLLQRRTHVLLADFGIARDTAESQQMTGTGAGIGTVEYMAPEQAVGQATPLSDIYSLGIVLYQMLTSTVPYAGSTPFQVLMKHTNDALPDPRLLNPSLPAEIVQVLQGALAKDPKRRFQSAQAMGRAVQQVRPDATPDQAARAAGNPPLSVAPSIKPSTTKPNTWHGQDFRDQPSEPVAPDYLSGPTPSRTGFTGVTAQRSGPPGWANAPLEGDDYDQPTWSTQGGRGGGTAPAWQQGGRRGLPPYVGGRYPQAPTQPRRNRGLVIALIAVLALVLVISSGVAAYVLGVFSPSTTSQTGQQGAPVNLVQATATATTAAIPTATATATATATPSPTPSPTPKPKPSPTPSPTPAPIPSIRGDYTGSYTTDGGVGSNPMSMQIFQSGKNLSGTTTEGSTTYNDTGTIDSNGNFTIVETESGGSATATLFGSMTGGGSLGGTWTASGESGTWTVSPA
ncbi:MAG TPA: serine/threonine-protein kinase [Ktedonobacterales bacterium]|nr:serine/threonine-protein kinase [Ktedonobacterales bacterium]